MIFAEQAIREEIFSGFCRTYNQAQTVTCEFTETEEGLELTEVTVDIDGASIGAAVKWPCRSVRWKRITKRSKGETNGKTE